MYRHDRPGESHDLLLDFLMEAAGRLLDREELELKREQAEGLLATFADVEALALACKFTDCQHESEPRYCGWPGSDGLESG